MKRDNRTLEEETQGIYYALRLMTLTPDNLDIDKLCRLEARLYEIACLMDEFDELEVYNA